MKSSKKNLLLLYPPYDSVLGPYRRKDGRLHIVLNNSKAPKGTKGKTRTISYPKAFMESVLRRRLEDWETVDHKDDDFTNNDWNNFQILSRVENARKEMRRSHRKAKKEKRLCQECGSSYKTNVKSKRKFCGKHCAGKVNQRKMKSK